ncbi:MAG: DUF3160 domain-containing protein [Verrucomicrobia bacterium]|nr:DUF3160 domain-containing protein [Verrucomicrobiota bacterium]
MKRNTHSLKDAAHSGLYRFNTAFRLVALTLGVLVLQSFEPLFGQSALTLEKLPNQGGILLKWDLNSDAPETEGVYQLERSHDLIRWENLFELDLRPSSLEEPLQEYIDQDAHPISFYRLIKGGAVIASVTTAENGAELYGFTSEFKAAMEKNSQLTIEEFVSRYGQSDQYVSELSYDPTNAEFWDTLDTPPGTPEPNVPSPNAQDVRLDDFNLNAEETETFRKNGFVVSGRKGDHSFADSYYKIFTNDLPVFVSIDSFLQAWHQNYRGILSDQEEFILSTQFEDILDSMREQLPLIRDLGLSESLMPSLHDADFYLTVALSLFRGEAVGSILGESDELVRAAVDGVEELAVKAFPLFGRRNPEPFDFSQFKPRGHYTKSVRLQRYFRAAMWCGRVDFRVAGPENLASERELGTAAILQEALVVSGKLESWNKFDRFIQLFVGLSDSMTAPQLAGLLKAGGIESVVEIESLADLTALQQRIEAGGLGAQEIQSHGFVASPSGESLQLPRSFTLFGQRFVMDSWAMNHLVFDRIFWKGEKVPRRLPSAVDVAFTVFGNRSAAGIVQSRINDASGVPFRDGLPYQHHLASLAEVFDGLPEERWRDNIYTSWLHTLRKLSEPLDSSIPEVFRTKEWARKTMTSQLASWTQLRHNTVLYAKQSSTGDVLCSFPHSFVEPNLSVWLSLAEMAKMTADQLETITPSGSSLVSQLPPWLDPSQFPDRSLSELAAAFGFSTSLDHRILLNNQVRSLRHFQMTCEKLAEIVIRQNAEQELTNDQKSYLKNMVEVMVDYVGTRTYSGWYTRLFYYDARSLTGGGVAPAELWDPVVTDVHTDFPAALHGDPGTILHQAVGNTALMIISIQCQGTRVYAGPVSTYYEFTSGPGNFDRMTDEEWKAKLLSGNQPAEPEWTSGHRFPGKVTVPFYAQ